MAIEPWKTYGFHANLSRRLIARGSLYNSDIYWTNLQRVQHWTNLSMRSSQVFKWEDCTFKFCCRTSAAGGKLQAQPRPPISKVDGEINVQKAYQSSVSHHMIVKKVVPTSSKVCLGKTRGRDLAIIRHKNIGWRKNLQLLNPMVWRISNPGNAPPSNPTQGEILVLSQSMPNITLEHSA